MADSSLSMVRSVVSDARARLTRLAATAPIGGRVSSVVRPALTAIFTALDGADYAVTAGATRAWQLWTSEHRDPAAIQAAIASARSGSDSELAAAKAATDKLVADLARLSLPARPAPVDALQEATLAGLKADVRMLADGFQRDEVPGVLIDELKRRLTAGDTLGVWLLASSDWPRIYLTSRGIDPGLFDNLVASTVAQGGPDEETEAARAILRAIQSPTGLAGAAVAMKTAVGMRLDDLASFRWQSIDLDINTIGA